MMRDESKPFHINLLYCVSTAKNEYKHSCGWLVDSNRHDIITIIR